jgi:branched-chain amino acid transport system permease protein
MATRRAAVSGALGDWSANVWVRRGFMLLVLVLALLYPVARSNNISLDTANLAEVYVLLALGLNIVVGFAGLLDLGYAAFFAIGAYTAALLASSHFGVNHQIMNNALLSIGPGGIHLNYLTLIPVAGIVAALFGVMFGAPTLRLRGDYLAIVTLGFGEIVPKVIENLGPNNGTGLPNLTNGVNSITGIDSPPDINIGALHVSFSSNDQRPWYYLGLAIIIISIVIITRLRDSRLGRSWVAIREDEVAAAHAGINITGTRLTAFALGATFSGFAGLLEATRVTSVNYTQFLFTVSVSILVMVILGGIGSIPGVIIGGIVVAYLSESWLASIGAAINQFGATLHHAGGPIGTLGAWLAQLPVVSAQPMIFGFILLFTMLLRPQGIWPERRRARELHPETEQILDEEQAELYTVRTGEI